MTAAHRWSSGPAARLAIRTTVAGVLTYAIATGLELPQAYWAVMTALIVVQGSVGGTLGAGLDRMAGTLGGAALGTVVALLQPFLGLTDGVALAVAIAPLAMLAARQPRFRVAPLTATIILLGSPPEVAPYLAATHRVLEILLGSLIGLGVSLLVVPARAHALLKTHTAEALLVLGDLAERHLAAAASTTEHAAIERLSARYRRLLTAAETAAREARRERTSRLTDAPAPEPAVRVLRRLRSDVAMLGRASAQPLPDALAARAAPGLGALAAALRSFIAAAAATLESGTAPPDLAPIDRAIAAFLDGWAKLQPEIETAAIAGQCPRALLALPFTIETLRRDLGDLVAISSVLAGVPLAVPPVEPAKAEIPKGHRPSCRSGGGHSGAA